MIYVLDTNILSTFRRKKPHPAIAEWVSRIGWRDLTVSVVTIAEIQCGAERTRKQHPDVAAAIDLWLERMLADGEPQILPMGVYASRLLGKMYETPSLRRFIITDPTSKNAASGADLAIAAIAIAEGAVVVTNNVADFLEIHAEFRLPGLFDPINNEWHVQPPDGLTSP
jgi:hypothetical protein